MFGIGGFELFLILLFGFLIFGPDRLPAIAKTIGQAISRFRKAQNDMNGTLRDEVFDKDSDEPFKNPLNAIQRIADSTQKTAEGTAAAGGAATVAQKTGEAKAPHTESFAERKARYDKERTARKTAEKEEGDASTAATSSKGQDSSDATKPPKEQRPTAATAASPVGKDDAAAEEDSTFTTAAKEAKEISEAHDAPNVVDGSSRHVTPENEGA